ncbi:hypothetical protein HpHNI66_08550 [Helicobacter pylori]
MFFSLAFLSFSLILFLMFSVWFKCCWFVLGVYSLFFILYSLFFILYSLFFILYSLFFILYSAGVAFISFVFNFLVGVLGVGMGVVFEWFFVFLDF